MADFPALPLWTDAFLADTTHLSAGEVGAYMLLLMTAWRRPDCDLPDDDKFLAKTCRCDLRKWRHLRPVMLQFHTVDNSRWIQKRLQKERKYVDDLSKKMSEISNRRWNKNKDIDDAPASPTQCYSDAPTPTPTKKEERKKEAAAPFWNGTGAGAGTRPGGRAGGFANDSVTIQDPKVRLGKFMNKLAVQIELDHPGVADLGWITIIAATDAKVKSHGEALALCMQTARVLGKGWPKEWPTDGKFFDGQQGGSVSHET